MLPHDRAPILAESPGSQVYIRQALLGGVAALMRDVRVADRALQLDLRRSCTAVGVARLAPRRRPRRQLTLVRRYGDCTLLQSP